jgi:hypothetical protein
MGVHNTGTWGEFKGDDRIALSRGKIKRTFTRSGTVDELWEA